MLQTESYIKHQISPDRTNHTSKRVDICNGRKSISVSANITFGFFYLYMNCSYIYIYIV